MAHTTNAEKILRRNLDKIAVEQNYSDPDIKVTPVSTEGANFTSFLFEATISSKQKKDDGLELFAKVSAVGEKFRSQTPCKVFDIERTFYTDLAKQYRGLEEKHGVSDEHRFKFPKIYAVDPTVYEETFVMENLTAKGYTLHDRIKSVDWDYAAAAFTEVAKMHALSMALNHEQPEVFHQYADVFTFHMDFFGSSGDEMKAMIEQGMQKTLEVTRDEHKGRLMAFLGQAMGDGGMEAFMKFYQPGEKPVIRHGDFRPSNIMHKVKEDGTLSLVVVDFQTLLMGNPVIDLLYFIFLGTDKQFRDQHYHQLIEHYYQELKAALARLGLDAEDVYSRNNFDEDLKQNLVYGLLISLITLMLVTVESGDAPEVTGDQDLGCFMNMKCSSVYADRINGIFEDFIKWGIL